MVVIAAGIVTKAGKALVSRQFVDVSRIRIEGLLAAFPKLVAHGQQHTYVDTDTVRYLYQPLENVYLVLVTNKLSNILEDLETLRLCAKVVPEFVQPVEEESIAEAAFDLIFAFDEVISMGRKENVTVAQVVQSTEMESQEEQLHKMIIASKIRETRDVMRSKATEIERKKAEARQFGQQLGGGLSSEGASGGYGTPGAGPQGPGGYGGASQGPGGYGGASQGLGGDYGAAPGGAPHRAGAAGAGAGRPRGKGLQLGRAGGAARGLVESLRAEGESVAEAAAPRAGGRGGAGPGSASRGGGAGAPAPAPVRTEPVFVEIEEHLSVSLSKDGGLNRFDLQGSLTLQVQDERHGRVRVLLAPAAPAAPGAAFQFKTHPNVARPAYLKERTLGLKDASRAFPAGNPLGILRWRLQTDDEEAVPLSINAWPSPSGSETVVNIEYESRAPFALRDVRIRIPVPGGQAPHVRAVDGDWQYDARAGCLVWTVDEIDPDANPAGTLEFVAPAAPEDEFFPVEATFKADKTLAGVQVDAVVDADSGEKVAYGTQAALVTDEYLVE